MKEENNKKRITIFDIIITSFLIFFIINTCYSYYFYSALCNKKEIKFHLTQEKKENKNVYNIALYNVIEKIEGNNRTVVLKLFFIR